MKAAFVTKSDSFFDRMQLFPTCMCDLIASSGNT